MKIYQNMLIVEQTLGRGLLAVMEMILCRIPIIQFLNCNNDETYELGLE